jgi:uncharacterized protein (TIGR02466 family)
MKIEGLFPTPIFISAMTRPFTKKEVNCFDKYKKNAVLNAGGNKYSKETFVLHDKNLVKLKKELFTCIQYYFDNVFQSKNNVTPIITQSWLNWNEKNQGHHIHRHSNSVLSGVLYIKANREVDTIKFYKDNNPMIELTPEVVNAYNCKSWWHPVHTGDIFLFPSSLMHGVDVKQEDDLRISLSFNVFVEGTIGDDLELNLLNI